MSTARASAAADEQSAPAAVPGTASPARPAGEPAADTTAARRPTVRAAFTEAPLAVKTLLAGVFINRLGGFLNIFLVLYLTSLGHSAGRATLALGAYGAGTVLGVLIGGSLSDRMGARNTTAVSMAASAVLTAALLYLTDYAALLAVVVLAGLAGQMFRPASAALLSELAGEDRQVMVFAMYRFGLNLGAMAAPLVGFGLFRLGHDSYDLLFWGEAAIALAFAVLAWRTLPPGTARGRQDAATGSYLAVLRDRRFSLYLVATLIHTAVYAQYLSTLPLDVAASGLAVFWYTVAVSLNGFLVIAFELVLTKVTQDWPVRVTIGLAFALLGSGVALYGLPMGPAVIVTATLVWTLGEIIGGPAIFSYPAVVAPDHLKSHYLGSFHFAFGLGSAVGPVAGGWLFAELGHSFWFVLGGASALATLLVLASLRNPARRPGA
ncbi:MFS transporter [Streptomyces antimicrobicus]|uniref:MFS transporter n=1 Tax=Streptomyces antimicrobicus TaxID=2883108 RepID=A0ABS8B7I3_9ACTN|nr:MFS transporter [Streptomyces antimicrobicus]MCB5180567.1 MFS transporter [Streptomyces antimicrobicus]